MTRFPIDIVQMAPPSGRRTTLVKALERVQQACKESPLIVEVGTLRDARPAAQYTDGWATLVFAWYASETHGRVLSIDNDRAAVDVCRRVVEPYWQWVTHLVATPERDTREVLSRINGQIDLLYLDGPHGGPDCHEQSAQFHLACYRCLKRPAELILIDDAGDNDAGVKGELVVPAAMEDGYSVLFHEQRQIAMVRS